MVFRNICILVLWMKVASALEGLKSNLTLKSTLIIHSQSTGGGDKNVHTFFRGIFEKCYFKMGAVTRHTL